MDLIQNIPDWLILINKCKQQHQKQATVRQSGSVFVLACCLTIGPWCNEPLGQTLLLFPSLPAQARFENPRIFFLSVRLKIVLKHIPLICRQLWALSFFSFFFFFFTKHLVLVLRSFSVVEVHPLLWEQTAAELSDKMLRQWAVNLSMSVSKTKRSKSNTECYMQIIIHMFS